MNTYHIALVIISSSIIIIIEFTYIFWCYFLILRNNT
jgi:hypothetical protein